jgi:PTH1 family peptidyl-tRNA hydrolase
MGKISRLFDRFRPAAPVDQEPDEIPGGRWVIAGLGNPGEQYSRSRHNLGFKAARRLAAKQRVALTRRKFNGLYAETSFAGAPCIIVTPQTFYKRSGEFLATLMGNFKEPVERLIVVHDEMDLPLPQIRIKRGGSDAGNRGVRSIVGTLGNPDFIRVRIGISHPSEAAQAIEHVLKPLTADELRLLDDVLGRVSDAIASIIAEGLGRAMSVYNRRV